LLLSELDPRDPDLAFGLCGIGLGEPALGYVRLSELTSLLGALGLPVERDRAFAPGKRIAGFAAEGALRPSALTPTVLRPDSPSSRRFSRVPPPDAAARRA